jgi:acylphosphatase
MKYHCEISVSGRVQGVGYRYFVEARALELNLKGFVRNHRNGGVQIEAEGESIDLDAFLDYLKTGPSLARVDHVEVSRAPYTGVYEDFTVRY